MGIMKIKKKHLKIAAIIVFLIFASFLAVKYINKDPYSFKDNHFYYSKFRGFPEYKISLISHNDSLDIYAVNFESKPFLNYKTRIYSLLLLPKNADNIPGLILLPGGGVSKENELATAAKIADLGYAVLTFDQRGIGETGGYYLSFEEDYNIFLQGKEPVQHLSVFDALKAFDVLRSIKGIDKNNIAIAGESMGGRYAMIAAALDDRIKGFIGISASGFHVGKDQPPYFQSIDPDSYISAISPRKVFMFHGTNDSVIQLKDAEFTFSLAREPKKFYTAEGCGHGYCDKMYGSLKSSLKDIFGK